MEFEPLPEELEEALRPIVDAASAGGWAEDVDFTSDAYRGLRQAGMFERVEEHYDGTASVMPSFSVMRYFERKEKWKAGRVSDAAGKAGGKLADIGGGVIGAALAKMLGL